MRIAYLSTAAIPSRYANSVHVMKMCRALAASGHQVRLVAPAQSPDAGTGGKNQAIFRYYGVDADFDLCFRWRPKMPGASFFYALSAAATAVAWRPDLAYGRDLISVCLAAAAGLPAMLELHDSLDGEKPFIKEIFSRLLAMKSFRGIVVITDALRRHYEERWPELEGRITVAPDGADDVPEGITPSDLRGRAGVLKVGYVGSLYPGKGMEVIASLAPLCGWADFHVVGGLEQDIRRWSAECAAVGNILFYGHVPPSDTAGFVQAFDVVLLPNQKQVATYGGGDIGQWTSPLKMFEYMAAGKAIIASDLAVLREVLEDGRNALLCDSNDVESWRNALERLEGDHGFRHRIASAARADFKSRYSWAQRAERLIRSV